MNNRFLLVGLILPNNNTMERCSILLIEDDEIERLKFKRASKKAGYECKVMEALDGEEALTILESDEELPGLILLDLNMPRMNGFEFLEALKSNPCLGHLPVVILSTSTSAEDLKNCYAAGIAGYVLKPLNYDQYVEKIRRVLDYWSINEIR